MKYSYIMVPMMNNEKSYSTETMGRSIVVTQEGYGGVNAHLPRWSEDIGGGSGG